MPMPLAQIHALKLQHRRPGLALVEWSDAAARGVGGIHIDGELPGDTVTRLLREAEVGAELRRLTEEQPSLPLCRAFALAEGRVDGGLR